MTTAGMRALRAAATLADLLPRARVRIRDGARQLCAVDAAGEPESSITPHEFRSAVAHAWRCQQRGMPLQFLGLDGAREVAIDIGLPAGAEVLPGHIYRYGAHDGRRLYLFLTDLSVRAARVAIGDAFCRGVGFHADPVTKLVAVHILCPPEDDEPARLLMARLLEICVAAEAIAELAEVVA